MEVRTGRSSDWSLNDWEPQGTSFPARLFKAALPVNSKRRDAVLGGLVLVLVLIGTSL